MLENINDILEIVVIAIGVLLLERYVFLEPGISGKRKKILFYSSSIIFIIIAFIIYGKDIAEMVVILAGGLNIAIGRKKHRLRGFFLLIPLPGILNGLVVPVLVILPNLLFPEKSRPVYCFCVYIVLALLMLLFYLKGTNWRKWFHDNIQKRHMHRWEKILLFVSGTLMMSFSDIMARQIILNQQFQEKGYDYSEKGQFTWDICIFGIISFVLVITIIILIMQGNLREEKERADAANKAKSAFISNISHEIRTPMNAIVGMTQILLRMDLPKQEQKYLLNIQNSGNALLAIINDLLDISKIESGKMELVNEEYDFMSMLNDLGMIILNRIGDKDIELLFDIDPDIPAKMYGDILRIRQIIINLLNNATKFTEKGYVCLSVKIENIQQDDIELFISVKDTGQGIRKEDISKLFGAFQQVDEKKNHHKEGTGLGLSISRQLTELMGGNIGVSSEYGKGSEFYFNIHQKIVDSSRAAQISGSPDVVIASNMKNKDADIMLRKLAGQYNLTYKEDIASDYQPDVFVLYFTDQYGQMDNKEKQLLDKQKVSICCVTNPMVENNLPDGIFTIDKPLYSYNFCNFIEDLQEHGKNTETAEENVDTSNEKTEFLAPDAKVLVADDNEINRMVVEEMLRPYGMQVDTAINGRQAVDMVKQKKYDIVFMDHIMPEMDGIEAVKAIRGLEGDYYKEIPVIALTANAAEEQQKEYIQAGMDDYICKPVDMEEISGKIRKWIPDKVSVL